MANAISPMASAPTAWGDVVVAVLRVVARTKAGR